MEFSILPSHFQWIALYPLEPPDLTKHDYMITWEMFSRGFCVLGFDLTPDKADEEHISLPRQGKLRIEARFKKPLPETVACILYAAFPGHVEIDNSRNVTVK